MFRVTKACQVFGIGQCALDYIGAIEAYPPADQKCEFTDMVVQGGGPVATSMVALSRWGISCAFSGVIGDDTFGAMIRDSLADEGIQIRGLQARLGNASQFAFVVAEAGTGSRTIFWRRPTGPALAVAEIDWAQVDSADVLYTDGLYTEVSLVAAKRARASGTQVVVDAGSLREGMLKLARHSDHFIASENFARQMVAKDDPEEACRQLAKLGPRVVGVTLGERGYVALEGDRWITKPAHRADAVDTTGCGDVFHAGYTYGLLEGWPTVRRLDFAAWVAARVSTQLGGRSGIPDATDYPAAK